MHCHKMKDDLSTPSCCGEKEAHKDNGCRTEFSGAARGDLLGEDEGFVFDKSRSAICKKFSAWL